MKKNKYKLLVSVVFSSILLLNTIVTAFADSTDDELTVLSTPDEVIEIDENSSYALDSVIVELTNSASLELNDYTADDFSEIDAENVENLTEYSTERIK